MDKNLAFTIRIKCPRTYNVAERNYSSLRKVNAALSGIVMGMLVSDDNYVVEVIDNLTEQIVKRFTKLDDWFKDAEALQ